MMDPVLLLGILFNIGISAEAMTGALAAGEIGAQRALDFGHGIAVASLMGIITGVFGGILRDMLCNRLPLVFKEELYASVSFITVWLFLILVKMDISDTVSVPLTLVFGFTFRMLALRYGWKMPRFVYTTEQNT